MTRPPDPSQPSTLAAASPELIRVGQLTWRIRSNAWVKELTPVLENPDAFLANRELQFKNTRTVTVSRIPPLAPGLPGLVMRRLNYGQPIHRLRDWLRPTRARRAFVIGLRLEKTGVNTPRPVAAAEARRLQWPLRAYLITEEVPGAQTLARFLTSRVPPPRSVVHELAALIAGLHERGFSHRDLKATNVLLDRAEHPHLIDLDGIRFCGRISNRRAAEDLTRLASGLLDVSSWQRLASWRFLLHYCEARASRINPRHLASMIAAASRA